MMSKIAQEGSIVFLVIFLYIFYLHFQISTSPKIYKNDALNQVKQNNVISFHLNKKIVLAKTAIEKLPIIAIHDPKLCMISDTILQTGYWEKPETEFLLKIFENFPNHKVVIDVGGNIGWFTSLSLSQGKKVFSFEPSEFNLEVFNTTLRFYPSSFRENLFQVPFPVTEPSKKGTKYCFEPGGNINDDNWGNFRANNGDCRWGFIKQGNF